MGLIPSTMTKDLLSGIALIWSGVTRNPCVSDSEIDLEPEVKNNGLDLLFDLAVM